MNFMKYESSHRAAPLAAVVALMVLGGAPLLANAEEVGLHDPAITVTAAIHPLIPAAPQGPGTVLTFEGLGNAEAVNNFYNGGTGGSGSGPGTNFGIAFSTNSLALIDSDAGGSGNFGGEPSPDTVLFFVSGGAATMNVAAGFTTGFSFFYSAVNAPGSIAVYDGLNATGNVLATLALPLTPFNGAPDPTGIFSPLLPIGVTFPGTAMSVDFGGSANQVAFDNITLGSSTPGGGVPAVFLPVPLTTPAGIAALAGLLLLAAGLLLRRRSRLR